MPPALSTSSLRTSASPPASGLAVEECVDTGVSGAKSDRPARNKLLEAARLRQVDLVLVLRLGRWGRSVANCVHALSAEDSSLMGRFHDFDNVGVQ